LPPKVQIAKSRAAVPTRIGQLIEKALLGAAATAGLSAGAPLLDHDMDQIQGATPDN
jgi:hypothetical protein